MFEKSLRIRKFCRGDNHPDVAIGLGDVGLIYHMKKDYDKAIENHKRGLDISASLLGNNHPDTGSCYQNLGGAFYEQGNLDAALEMCKKAKEAYVASFGSDHPKSEQAQGWLDIVEGAIKDKITMG
jgi:tetratricopeptide (TPR) repeat protein